MTEHSLWRFSRAFHRAINERQLQDVEALLDDDVEWSIYGPIDLFPFFGSRRGKAAVLDVISTDTTASNGDRAIRIPDAATTSNTRFCIRSNHESGARVSCRLAMRPCLAMRTLSKRSRMRSGPR